MAITLGNVLKRVDLNDTWDRPCGDTYNQTLVSLLGYPVLTEEEKNLLSGQSDAMRYQTEVALFTVPITDYLPPKAAEALCTFAKGGAVATVIFKLAQGTETEAALDVAYSGSLAIDSVSQHLPDSEPRYVLQRMEHQAEGQNISTNVILLYVPSSAPPNLLVRYAMAKHSLVELILECGLELPRTFVREKAENINVGSLMEEMYPPDVATHRAEKPKRAEKVRKGTKAKFAA